MKQMITLALSVALWGGVFALWSCEKVAPAELSPKTVQAAQALVKAETGEKLSPAQLAWMRFVDKVERGEQLDPTGQYVSKTTVLPAEQAGERTQRPKYDAAKKMPLGLIIRASGTIVPTDGNSLKTDPNNPPVICTDGCATSGPPVTSTFISSEGVAPYSGSDNPNGYVWDLKIGHGSARGDHYGIPDSYTVLYSDLNKGAGGHFIYIGFSRIPSNVSESPESIYGNPYAVGAVTYLGITKKYSYKDKYAAFLPPLYYVWVDTGRRLGFDVYDLNEGVGGTYIRAIQSKSPNSGLPLEVGVLSGNSSSIQPPAGWNKASIDLNEGAGGDFIYFCVKAH